MAAGPVYIAERTTGHGVEIHRGWLRIEISLTSETSFEDAIEQGIKSGGEECRNLVASAWVKDHRDNVDVGVIVRYQVSS